MTTKLGQRDYVVPWCNQLSWEARFDSLWGINLYTLLEWWGCFVWFLMKDICFWLIVLVVFSSLFPFIYTTLFSVREILIGILVVRIFFLSRPHMCPTSLSVSCKVKPFSNLVLCYFDGVIHVDSSFIHLVGFSFDSIRINRFCVIHELIVVCLFCFLCSEFAICTVYHTSI